MAGASMTVDLQAEDYASFTIHLHRQPELRRRRHAGHKRFAIIMIVGLLLMLVARSWNGGHVPWGQVLTTYGLVLAISLGAMAVLVLGYERLLPALIRFNVRRLMRQQADSSLFGEHRLDFGPEGIVDTTASASGQVPWDAVSRVEETPQHFYVMLSSLQGVIIPKRGQDEGTLAGVRRIMREHVADAGLSA